MGRTFSENWYRIADLRLGPRPTVSARVQYFQGDPWYVLHERVHNTFHRVDPPTWRFLSRLSVEATVDETWRASIEADPSGTPGQDDVFQLLSSLYHNNLLYIEGNADEKHLVERGARKRRKPFLARLSELLFMRIPLFDPDPLLRRFAPVLRHIFGWPGIILGTAAVIWGLWELLLAVSLAQGQASRIFQLHNVLLLYLAVFIVKMFHELGHASICRRFGGEVRTIGVMLLMFTPVPYVDVSSSWAFRNRWHRLLVDAGGILVDMVVAGAATVVWAHSPPGAVNELAYNLMFSAAVYTLVFNLNPLMRFDGYFILSDLLGVPNLYEQGAAQFRSWVRTRILGAGDDGVEAKSPATALMLGGFFLASNAYRLLVMAGIVLFIADAYLGVGLIVGAALATTAFVRPLQNMLKTLSDPFFRARRHRLLRLGALAAGGLAVFFLAAPMPDNRVLPGVAEAKTQTRLFTETGGVVAAVHASSGEWVDAGALLVELKNPELEAELSVIEAQIMQTEVLESRSFTEGAVDLAPVRDRLRTLVQFKEILLRQQGALAISAPHAGYWVAPELGWRRGSWVPRGSELGQVIDDRKLRFMGVIRQEAASLLAKADREGIEVRLDGDVATVHKAEGLILVPHSHGSLPSAILSPVAGGEVPVSGSDPHGRRSAEPFFLLLADIVTPSGDSATEGLKTGRSGWIRVHMPWRPLAAQAWMGARQFIQRRYTL